MATASKERFSSRLGLILSVLGIAVGTGNIWRFPRIAAQNGGEEGAGAFLVAWVTFLLLWSIPLIIAEYAMGRKGRMGIVGTFAKVAGERFAWMGAFVGFVATAIMFYYSVVAGWCLHYFVQTVSHPLPLSSDAALSAWDGFQSGLTPLVFHACAIGLGGLAVWQGVKSIEKVNKVLIPVLLGIVLIAVVRTLMLPGAWDGVSFLFTPQWDLLREPSLWLEALTQNAWDTGAGWGLILTYAAYMKAKDGVVQNAFITGVSNNIVSLLAAIIVFGTVFATLGTQMSDAEALQVMKESGPASTGLTFIWMPQLFAQMPGGKILASLFFLGLAFAALSSLISMIELVTRTFVDAGMRRSRAVAMVGGAGFVLGVPSALDLTFFSNQDFVWGVGLILSGAFVATAILRYGVGRFRRDAVDNQAGDWTAGRGWEVLIGVVVPLQAVVLLGWWLWQSATIYAPDTWYDPFDPFSVATCVVQWGLALAVFLVFNRAMVRRTLHRDKAIV